MARKTKFPLKMADEALVRSMEELREHFDLASVLKYYDNGKLGEWLTDRYYEEEAQSVQELDASSADFKQQLCNILGVQYSKDVDLTDISVRNRRLEHLKQYTADDGVLAAVDRVAFTQEELESLLDKEVQEIYLCGECFDIPGNVDHIALIGVDHPTVHLKEEMAGRSITFKGVRFDAGELTRLARAAKDPVEAVAWWTRAAQAGDAEAQFQLADCYENGNGVGASPEDAVKWYRSAAELGLPKAQRILGNCYRNGYVVEQNDEIAADWYRKAAEQSLPEAQNALGIMYWQGNGVEQSYEEANRWFLQGAEQGWHWAQHNLGISYRDGQGIEQNKEKAIEWLQKAADQKNDDARAALLKLAPRRFELSEVLLCAIGGKENLFDGSSIDLKTDDLDSWNISIMVHNRFNVDEDLFYQFGAKRVSVEVEYETKLDEPDTVGKKVFNLFHCKIQEVFTDEAPDYFGKLIHVDTGWGKIYLSMDMRPEDMESLERSFPDNIYRG